MLKYSVRRILYMFPILLGITLVTFMLFNVAGGDPAIQMAGKYATEAEIEAIRKDLGTSGPLYVQFGNYVKQIVTFDFGRSWATKQEVTKMIFGEEIKTSPILVSMSLTFPAFAITLFLAISIGLLLTFYKGGLLDKTIMIVCLAAISFSSLVYILFLQYYLGYKVGMFPISGISYDWIDKWNYLALPIIIFVAVSLGSNVLFFRTIFLDEVFQDYVRTARAKGLSNKVVMFKHVLRNALIPIITLVVIQIPFLITGTLLIESFFSLPGLGGLIYNAINNADFPVIKAMTFISAVLYMCFQLLSDILYAVVDPKVQLK